MHHVNVLQSVHCIQGNGTTQEIGVGELLCWKNPDPNFETSDIMLTMLKDDVGEGPFTLLTIVETNGEQYFYIYSPIQHATLRISSLFFQKHA